MSATAREHDTRGGPGRLAAVACLLGAATIHRAQFGAHLAQWFWTGAFFILIAFAEGALAVALSLRVSPRLARWTLGISLATVAVWMLSRTVGLPFGPGSGVAEPVGRADLIATLFELTTAAALFSFAVPPEKRRPDRLVAATIVTLVVGLSSLALAVPGGASHETRPPEKGMVIVAE